VYSQFYRLVAKNSKDVTSVVVIIFIIASITFAFFIPFFEMKFPSNWHLYAWLLLAVVFYAVNDKLKSIGYKHLDISVISIMTQLSKVFLVMIGIIFFEETININEGAGIAFIIIGGVLVVIKKNVFSISKYIGAMIIAAIAFAIALSIDVSISLHFNLAIYLVVVSFLPILFIFLVEKKKPSDLKNEFYRGNKKRHLYFVLAGVGIALASLTYLTALRQGQVSIVAPLTSSVVLLNTIIGYIFLKERDDLKKRVFAALLVITGVFLLV
jgi:drug/metabolite transporter (DMT)-like permease